jgi:hypothetical protein
MKHRIVIISAAVAFGLAVSALVLFAASQTAPALAGTISSNMKESQQQPSAIVARRLISVPFGIDSPLNMTADGQMIDVTGHGNCEEIGNTYNLRVNVTQESSGAKAKGNMQSTCQPDTQFQWSIAANANTVADFQPGSAQACGMVVIYPERGGAGVYRWCKTVDLVESP